MAEITPDSGRELVYPGVGHRISGLIRRYRQETGRRITQAEIADEAGVSRATLSIALNQDRLTLKTARKLARFFRVFDLELLLLSDTPEHWEPTPPLEPAAPTENAIQLEGFVNNLDRIIRRLSSGTGELGPKSKLAILNGIEEAAREAGEKLPAEFYDLRRAINEGRV